MVNRLTAEILVATQKPEDSGIIPLCTKRNKCKLGLCIPHNCLSTTTQTHR